MCSVSVYDDNHQSNGIFPVHLAVTSKRCRTCCGWICAKLTLTIKNALQGTVYIYIFTPSFPLSPDECFIEELKEIQGNETVSGLKSSKQLLGFAAASEDGTENRAFVFIKQEE